jgi:hypothetical protein
MKFKNRELTDIEIDGIEIWDYPDFCDAYISAACFADTGEPLTDDEIDELRDAGGNEYAAEHAWEYESHGDAQSYRIYGDA